MSNVNLRVERASPPLDVDYVQKKLAEPLRRALTNVVLFRPLDAITFIANYLRFWSLNVQHERRKLLANTLAGRLLVEEVPRNMKLLLSSVVAHEANQLIVMRNQFRREKLRRQAEQRRVRDVTRRLAEQSMDEITTRVAEDLYAQAHNWAQTALLRDVVQAKQDEERKDRKLKRSIRFRGPDDEELKD